MANIFAIHSDRHAAEAAAASQPTNNDSPLHPKRRLAAPPEHRRWSRAKRRPHDAGAPCRDDLLSAPLRFRPGALRRWPL